MSRGMDRGMDVESWRNAYGRAGRGMDANARQDAGGAS